MRWLRLLLLLVFDLLLAAHMVLLVAFFTLQSPPGRAWLAQTLAQLASDEIAGTVHLGGLEGDLINRLRFLDGLLFDKNGQLVASLPALEIRYDLAPLLDREFVTTLIRFEQPDILADPTLVGALSPLPSDAPETPSKPPDFAIILRRVELRGGRIRLPEQPEEDIATLEFDAAGRIELAETDIQASATMQVRNMHLPDSIQPASLPRLDGAADVEIAVALAGNVVTTSASADLILAGHTATLAVSGSVTDLQPRLYATLITSEVHLAPPLTPVPVSVSLVAGLRLDGSNQGTAMLSTPRLAVDGIRLDGTTAWANLEGNQLSADLSLALPETTPVQLHADYSLTSQKLLTTLAARNLRTSDYAAQLPLPAGTSATLDRLSAKATAALDKPDPQWTLSATLDATDLAILGVPLDAASLEVFGSGTGGRVAGRAMVSAPTLSLPAIRLEDLVATLVIPDWGPLRIDLGATFKDGFFSLATSTAWDGTWRPPETAQILGLTARYRGVEVASEGTAQVTLGDLSDIAITPWQLNLAGGAVVVAGHATPAANQVQAKLRWQDLQLAPISQALGLPQITSVATGEITLGGASLASPTIHGSVQLRGLEQQTTDLVRDLTATFSYDAGMARGSLDASPQPTGHLSASGTLPIDLSLRPLSFQFHDAPDADFDVDSLPLAALARFLPPELGSAGVLSATGHVGGTFEAPEWELAGTVADLSLPALRPLSATFNGQLDAKGTNLTIDARWTPTSSLQLNLTAPALRLLPVPEDLSAWLVRLPPERDWLTISSPSLEVADILREPPPLRGTLAGTLRARGGLESLSLIADLHVRRPVYADLALAEHIDLMATHQNSVLDANGQITLRAGGQIRISGQIPVALSLMPFSLAINEDEASAEVWFAKAQLSAIAMLVPEALRSTGVLDGYASFAMPLTSPRIDVALRARDVTLPKADALDVFLTATVEDDLLTAAAGLARAGRDLVRIQTHAPAWRLDDRGDSPARWLARWHDGRHSLRAQVNSLRLADFVPTLPPEATLTASASVLEIPDHVALYAEVGGLSWSDQQLKLVFAGDSDTLQAKVRTDLLLDGESVASATGTVGDPTAGSWLDTPLDAPINFSADLSNAVDILLRLVGSQYNLTFEVPPTLTATVQGSLNALSATLNLGANRASIRGLAVQQLTADAHLNDQGAHFALTLLSQDAGTVLATADLASPCLARILAGNCTPGDGELSGHITVADVSDRPLRQFLPRGYEVNFDASGDVVIGGTLASPTLDGSVAANIARLRIPPLGWDLTEIAVRLHSDGHAAVLEPVRLALKDGSATLAGRLDLASKVVAATLQLDKMPVSNRAGLRIIADGEAGVRGTLGEPEIYGDLTIVEARIRDFPLASDELHPLQLNSDIVFASDLVKRDSLAEFLFGKSGSSGEEKASVGQRTKGQIKVHIPGHFFYTGQGADLELEGDLAIALTGLSPRLTGTVRTRRGEVNIFGRLFTLRKALVEFTGSTQIDPVLDVEAIHPLRGVDLSAYGLQSFSDSHILVAVGGRVSTPEMSVSSIPVMSEDQIMTVLVMGRSRGGTEQAGADATGLLAGLIAQPLQAKLVRKLPVDTLNLQTGEKGFEDARVSTGRYLASWLFLRYVYQFGAAPDQNRNEGHMEVRFSNRFLLETVYGDAGAGSADFFFRMNY